MKIRSLPQLNDFIATVNECNGQVWMESPEGDKYNLKSVFSRCVSFDAISKLLAERGDYLELFCSCKDDEKLFFGYFNKHPEVQASF